MGANEKPAAAFHPDPMLLTAPVVGRCPMDAGLLMRTIDGEIHCRNADCPDYLAVTKMLTAVEFEPRDGIEVFIRDLRTGETESKVIWDDYMLIVAGNRYLANVEAFPSTGTHVLTVRRDA